MRRVARLSSARSRVDTLTRAHDPTSSAGGCATVYRATSKLTGEEFALKRLVRLRRPSLVRRKLPTTRAIAAQVGHRAAGARARGRVARRPFLFYLVASSQSLAASHHELAASLEHCRTGAASLVVCVVSLP